jgi:hypothetical protein
MNVPVLIICRDRLASLLELLSYLERAGCEDIHLVDNGSTYEPLLEYYEQTPHHVIRLEENAGPLAPWHRGLLPALGITGKFVLSDPDIVPIAECPLDAIDYFAEILDRFPRLVKAGFGLKIDDIPDTYPLKQEALAMERFHSDQRLGPRLYAAPVDTSFALYRAPGEFDFMPAARTGYPYLARHWTWYLDAEDLPDDERHYRNHSSRVPWYSRDSVAPKLARQAAALRDRATIKLGREARWPSTWSEEPELVDEAIFTEWASPGWHSWSATSPELEFCQLAATIAALVEPHTVIETGTGTGFLTRRLSEQLGPEQQLHCFESDPESRGALALLPFFGEPGRRLSSKASPEEVDFPRAEFAVLDSAFEVRLGELETWWRSARPGAIVLIHDAGNGHRVGTHQARIAERILELEIPGAFLSNPRGGFLGVKGGPSGRAGALRPLMSPPA